MKHGWIDKTLSGHAIERIPCPNPGGRVDESKPASGVLHTIEGSLESGLTVFKQHYAPHFTLDGSRIVQLVPLGAMGAALENHSGGLETNSWARAQIEVAGFSKEQPWLPDDATLENLSDLLATLARYADIPLFRPFPQEMPKPPWATYYFERRGAGKWGKVAGWYGHVEIPENSHWDPGYLQWDTVLAKAQEKFVKPAEPITKDDKWTFAAWWLGEREFAEAGPHNPKARPAVLRKRIPASWWVWLAAYIARRHKG